LAIKKDMSKSTKEYLKDYEDYLRIHNFSRSTVQAYKLGLRKRLEFRQAYNLSERINQDQAREFILFKYDTRAIGKRLIMCTRPCVNTFEKCSKQNALRKK
jgi:hypothetical protein